MTPKKDDFLSKIKIGMQSAIFTSKAKLLFDVKSASVDSYIFLFPEIKLTVFE
jgi:hypothetical protein